MLKEKITVSFLPTALAERMIDQKWPAAQTALRFLLTGADTLRKRPPAGLPFQFVNNYGPTEATVVATSGIVAPEGDSKLPSIGAAIDGAIIEIRDGELLIGGGGVARGYRNQPALTAERFLHDPAHGRMYRTGDLAAWLPNNEIAFEGRADDQIKIRGFRIEPNEIVRALAQNPLVRESAVILRERLIAYVVPNSAEQLSERSLQESLRKTLPDYMMPSVFVMVETLPYTENGKLDRHALPDPDLHNTIRDEEFEAPQNPLEEKVAEVICELLHLDRVGINDNFFLLGGHSLLGAQLVDRVNRDFSLELTLRSVFDYPTVAGLAAEIESAIMERVESMSEEEAQRLLS
jgi:acyl-CoA synthetase (AMP-forming)/AMP-acid ligase II/acyl carrier protein